MKAEDVRDIPPVEPGHLVSCQRCDQRGWINGAPFDYPPGQQGYLGQAFQSALVQRSFKPVVCPDCHGKRFTPVSA